MKEFNAFQFVAIFIGLPFFINWLSTNPFAYSGIIKWVSCVAYVVMFIVSIVAVRIWMSWIDNELVEKK